MPEKEITRREFTRSLALVSISAVPILKWLLNPRSYDIRPIDYEPGKGAQSHLWLPARVDISRRLDTLDQAEQIALGSYAYSAYRGSSGDLYQKGATELMNATPGGRSWVGDCFPASVASGDCPIIDGDMESPAEGLPAMSRVDRMVLATLYYRNCFMERTWGRPWTRDKFQEIQDIRADLQARGIRKYLTGDTSDMRGFHGQEWHVLIRGFEGESVLTTTFLDWEELGEKPRRKVYPANNYRNLTSITLADPSQPQPGRENNYYYTLNRAWAEVYLGMAVASLK